MKSDPEIEPIILQLIKLIGDDPVRAELKDTPKRVATRLPKIFNGYQANVRSLIDYKGMKNHSKSKSIIAIHDIDFISFCEHHMLPIIGTVDVEYIPLKKIIGISHVIKIVHAFTNRLQIQERITTQIAETLESCLKPAGVAVRINAKHYCTDAESTGKLFASVKTECLMGVFKNKK